MSAGTHADLGFMFSNDPNRHGLDRDSLSSRLRDLRYAGLSAFPCCWGQHQDFGSRGILNGGVDSGGIRAGCAPGFAGG